MYRPVCALHGYMYLACRYLSTRSVATWDLEAAHEMAYVAGPTGKTWFMYLLFYILYVYIYTEIQRYMHASCVTSACV